MLLPGRNLVWLAKAVGTLDQLSGGRFLLTFVPGLAIGGERSAIGLSTPTRAAHMEDGLPVLRRLWAGEVVSHDGPAGSLRGDLGLAPAGAGPLRRVAGRQPARRFERCGRMGDGWLPAFCTPEDAGAGKVVIDRVAAEPDAPSAPSTSASPWPDAPDGTDVARTGLLSLARRARGRPLEDIVPVGLEGLRAMIERFLDVGFSKFVVRPIGTAAPRWPAELARLAGAVGALQS